MTDARKAELFEMMLNDRCDVEGIYETIEYLSYECTKEELLDLGFDEEMIDQVLNGEEEDEE